MIKEKIIRKVEIAWSEFRSAFEGLTPEQMDQTNTVGEWSLKDILGHVATWEGEALKYIPVILQDKRLPRYKDMYGGIDAFNAMTVDKNRKLSLTDVWERTAQMHHQLVNYLQRLPEDQFRSSSRISRRIVLDTYGHYPYHTQAVKEWREHQVGGNPSGIAI